MGKRGLVRSAVFFPAFFLLTFALGIHFKAVGRHGLAAVLWFPINGFAAFIAVLEVSWDAWELAFEHRETDDGDDGTERTLKPREVSTNFKVATAVMASLFVAGGAGYAVWVYLIPPSYFEGTIPGFVQWYQANVLPYWQAA